MDIDLLKSTPDDQIDMMLMMHMEKPSGGDLYFNSPMISFASGGYNGGSMPQHIDIHSGHLTSNSTTLLNPHNTISISNNNNNNNIPSTVLLNSYGNMNGNAYPSSTSTSSTSSQKQTSMAAMREMIFRIAAMQPIYIDPEAVKPPKRRNVKISKDPQSVAARHRRERISEKIRILQRLVPGGTKMDTASMLDEAIHYVKFLKNQVQSLERTAVNNNRTPPVSAGLGFPVVMSTGNTYFPGGDSKANYSLGHQPNLGAPQQFSE